MMGRPTGKSDSFFNSGAGSSVLGRVVALVVAVGAFVLSLVVGAFVLSLIVGFMLIVAIIVGLRIWWLRRKMARDFRERGDIEAEYTVLTAEERITRQRESDR